MTSLLQNAKAQFIDINGAPLVAGSVYMYSPGTETPKATYQDAAGTIANTNPIVLDEYGQALIWGTGTYRQVVYDKNGNLIWDQVTQDVTAQITSGIAAVTSSLAAIGGSKLIGYSITDTGLLRTVQDRLREVIDPRDFGAKGNGVADDTNAIVAADTYARSLTPPGLVEFGNGVFMASRLTINENTNWKGNGRSTILRQIVGSNQDFVYGSNSAANWGLAGGDATGFPTNFSLSGFIIDGNWNAGAGNTVGTGYAVYGDHCQLENIYVMNCAEHGLRTEFQGDSATDYPNPFLEPSFKGIWVDTCGKHGWWDNGPHDAHHIDIHILDAGQALDSTWDGFFFGPNSSARNVAIHPATRSGKRRMRYSINLQPGAQHEFSGGCNVEGAGVANVGLFSSFCIFDPSTRFYAAWNGVNILLGGTNCSLNLIRGMLQAPPIGRPGCVGIQFSTVAGDKVNNNDIDVVMSGQEGGNIVFTAQDGGYNKIRATFFNTTNVGIFGTPNPTNDIAMIGETSAGSFEINTRDQLYSTSIAANNNVTLTFDYPFAKTPIVEVTPVQTAGPLTLPVWVSSRTTTGCIILNPNATALVVDVRVRGVF